MINLKLLKWINFQKKTQFFKVKKKDLINLDQWNFNKNEIYHKSKKFFKIIGIRIKSNFYKKNWDQPIILQNEIGILGIIKNIKTKKYLLQAKAEPGNINKVQISPTVQATKSNYSRIHGGKSIPYLKYFTKKNKYFSLQTEQAFRYFNKKNSNIITFTSKNINLGNSFKWFSKNEIIYLLYKKNLINMDTLSVFSSFIKKNKVDVPINSEKSILKTKYLFNKKYFLKSSKINLSSLKKWNFSSKNIVHRTKKYFSIIGIKIESNKREVKEWYQPIIKGSKLAFAGFIIKEFNKTDHYLCRHILKPGSKLSTFTCTANTSNLSKYKNNIDLTGFQKKIIYKYFINRRSNILYNNILSDEGGRFFHSQIRYMACKLKKNENINLPENYIWLSKNQIIKLIDKQKIDIEARLLFGIVNFKGII